MQQSLVLLPMLCRCFQEAYDMDHGSREALEWLAAHHLKFSVRWLALSTCGSVSLSAGRMCC